jgi:hypothetical protein
VVHEKTMSKLYPNVWYLHPKERDAILLAVRNGRMSTAEAESLAAERGFPKFAKPPDPKLDPLAEAYWDLAMVIAWICTRSADYVRRFWRTAVVPDTCGWFKRDEGFALYQLRCDPADFDQELGNTNRVNDLGRYGGFRELKKAALAERIVASGFDYGGNNKRHLIPTLDWHEFYLGHDRWVLGNLRNDHGGWYHLLFKRACVIKEWPRRSPKANRRPREEKAKSWFAELMDKNPDLSPKPVLELIEQAANTFEISKKGTREAYKKARQERPDCRWRAGRRPKQGA